VNARVISEDAFVNVETSSVRKTETQVAIAFVATWRVIIENII
jgi:hypothetical protein